MKNRAICVALLAAAGAAQALASNITFTISATGSGSVGASDFSDATVTFTQTATTAGILSQPCGPSTPCTLESTSNTVTISGVGTYTLPQNTFFFDSGGVIGFTQTGSSDYLDESDASFTGYQMLTSLGPVTDTISNGDTLSGVNTTGGTLDVDFTGDATFQAVLSPSSVPEPGSFLLMLAGAVPIGLALRRKRTGKIR